MNVKRSVALSGIASTTALAALTQPIFAADKLTPLVAAAKAENGELPFVVASDTFGGQPGVAALNDAFNKRFGFNPKLTLTPGPNMVAVGDRVLTEYKGNRPASTAFYMGPNSQFIILGKNGALIEMDWTGTFPWITRDMLIPPGNIGALVRTGINAIMYNQRLLPPDKAPKRYEDLVDPKMSAAWAGKLAMAPYVDWLVNLGGIWNVPRAREFTQKLVPIATGRLRYGDQDAQALVTGQFVMMANDGIALEEKFTWDKKGANDLAIVPGANPLLWDPFWVGVPKNTSYPNLAKLFVGWLISKDAQLITDNFGAQGSHLIPGTRVYQYVRDHHLNLWDFRKMYAFNDDPQNAELYTEFGKLLRA